jgi:hypothetical protein
VIARTLPKIGLKAWKNWKEAAKSSRALPATRGELGEVKASLRREANLEDQTSLTLEALGRALGCTPGEMEAWLDGTWLEQYVLDVVERIAAQVPFASWERGCQTKGPQFEMDVLAMRWHQLFAFSCTTAGELKACKLKLLEGRTRARQCGGDEAAFALVCVLGGEEVSQLKGEVPRDRRLRVFGMDDLPALDERVREWAVCEAGTPKED